MKYTHLFFDLDNTIWDFVSSSHLALQDVYQNFNLGSLCNCTFDTFYAVYKKNNDEAWTKFALNLITAKELKTSRFRNTFNDLNVNIPNCSEINKFYLDTLPTKAIVFPEVKEVLEQLKGKYEMHIISNGFIETQIKKLTLSNLNIYFDKIITSENAGVRKPHPDIIDFALKETCAQRESSIYIGDDFATDIVCAFNAGIDSIWVNRHELQHPENIATPTATVKDLHGVWDFLTRS